MNNRITIFILLPLLFFCLSSFGETIYKTKLALKFNTGNLPPYGMPSTIITIQGKKIPIIFDTGDSKEGLALTPKALKGIKVKYIKSKVCGMSIDGAIMCRRSFIIPEVSLGKFIVKNVHGSLIPHLWDSKNNKNFIESAASQNGVIGYKLLSKFNILLDYKSNKAILVKEDNLPNSYDVGHWVGIPFHSNLLTKLIINNKPMTIGWDTGSIPSIIKKSFVVSFSKYRCPSPFKKLQHCYRVLTKSIKVPGGSSIPNSWFKVVDIPSQAPFDALMGSNFFRNNLLYIDFKKHIIYVKSNK